jgi:hypothetical protein
VQTDDRHPHAPKKVERYYTVLECIFVGLTPAEWGGASGGAGGNIKLEYKT